MSKLTIRCLRGCVCAGTILEEGKTYTVPRGHGESLIKMGKAEPAEDAPSTTIEAAESIAEVDAPPTTATTTTDTTPPPGSSDKPAAEHGLELLGLPEKTVADLLKKNIKTAEELDEAIGAGLVLTSLSGLGEAGAQKLIAALDEVLGVEEDDTED